MSLQLRSFHATALKLSSVGSRASVYSTVTSSALPEVDKNANFFKEPASATSHEDIVAFTPTLLPAQNTRIGQAIHQSKKIARHMRRKLHRTQENGERQSLKNYHRQVAPLFPWENPFLSARLDSSELTEAEPHPMIVCENPEPLSRLIGDIAQVAKPLQIQEDDIISDQQHFGAQFNNNRLSAHPGNPAQNGKSNEIFVEQLIGADNAKTIFETHRRLGHVDLYHNSALQNHDSLLGPGSSRVFCTSQPLRDQSDRVNVGGDGDKHPEKVPGRGPSEEQLAVMHDKLAESLPNFFVKTIDYSLYHKDVVLENNFYEKPRVTNGISPYVFEMLKLRWWAHWRYSNVKLVVLKITHHKEDGTVKVRWRITGLPQFESVKVWKFLPWVYRKNLNTESEWHDAFSVFWVGSDGLIRKHKIDRIMPDEELETVKSNRLVEKMATLVGMSAK